MNEPPVQRRLEEIPIRLTKGRAAKLLEFFWQGVEAERASIAKTYSVTFNQDGTINVSTEDLRLLEAGAIDDMNERLGILTDAIDAASIVRRRYAT